MEGVFRRHRAARDLKAPTLCGCADGRPFHGHGRVRGRDCGHGHDRDRDHGCVFLP